MQSACFCGVEDSRKCRCLPAPRGQRGNRYENRGGGRGGNARGGQNRGRDESSWRDRDGSTWRDPGGNTLRDRNGSSWRNRDGTTCIDQDGGTWRDKDGSSWRDRGEHHPRGGMDRGTRGGRNRSARGVKSPLLPVPRGHNGERTAWRGGRGRGARFPGNGAANRGAYRNVGHPHSDNFESEGYYESTYQSYHDESFEGYHNFDEYYYDDMEQWGNEWLDHHEVEEETVDYRGDGTDGDYDGFLQYGDSARSRVAHPHSRGAGRGRSGVRGNRNPRERGARWRGSGARNGRTRSCSGGIERRPGSASASRSELDHDSDSEPRNTCVKNKSSTSKKDEKKRKHVEKTKTDKKIIGKSIDNLKGIDQKGNVCNRKSRSPKKDGNTCPRGNSRTRNNSASSNGSNSSMNTSDSSVNAKNSRVKRGKSTSKGSSDCSKSSHENDSSNGSSSSSASSNGSSRSSSASSNGSCSASSSCSSEGNSKRKSSSGKSKHNHLKKGQKNTTKSANQHKTSKDKRVDNSSKTICAKNESNGARKSLLSSNRKGTKNSESHRDRSSSNKFRHTKGSETDGSSDELNGTKTKATSETKTSKGFSRQKSEESRSSKDRIDAPSKVVKIGNAYVMDGADPLVLTEEEYKFMIGSATSSPEMKRIVNTTQSLPFSSDSLSRNATVLTEGDSLKSDTAPFPVIRYEWQFQDEQKSWITYGQPSAEGSPAFATTVSSDHIEKHYISDPNKQPVEIESNSVRYILDFTTMTQNNKHTLYQRRIRRVLKRPQAQTAPIKLLQSGSAGNIDHAWQFLDEKGVWITYGQPSTKGSPESVTNVTSDDIEKHYIKDPSKQIMEIQSNSYQYILDLEAMTQTNKQTLGQRRIRRVRKSLVNQRANPNIGVDAGGSTNEQYEWQFQDEHQAWIRYGSPNSGGDLSCVTTYSSDDIERHYCNDHDKSPFLLRNKKYQYQLNFQTKTQTNLHTRTQRPIRRVATQAPKRTQNQKKPNNEVPPAFEHEWFFLDESNRWIAYGQPNSQYKLECVPSISSDDIEKRYQQDPNMKFSISSQQHQYLVNFVEMTQTNTQTNTVRIIRRLSKNSSAAHSIRETFSRDSSSESLPVNWSLMPSSSPWTKVLLGLSDPEYASHIPAIQSAVPNVNVVSMYRVQNKYLWKAYANKKEYLKQQFPGINYKEQFLYHGTDPAHVEAICKENVDWRLHGSKNGNSFGRGSYFSNSAQMSAGYSSSQGRRTIAVNRNSLLTSKAQHVGLFPAAQQYGGIPSVYPPNNTLHGLQQQVLYNATQQPAAQPAPAKVMFIVRVLVGNITQGNSSTVRPPVDSSGQPYDTTVNNVANPTIFVKYDTQEYYPEYYIEFD